MLKRTIAREIPASAIALQQALIRRMPTRNLLDVLAYIEHWTHRAGPLAVLVPFLVFAIGVSHGVQQINFIVRELAHGASTMETYWLLRRRSALPTRL